MNASLRNWTLAACVLFGLIGNARGGVLGIAPSGATSPTGGPGTFSLHPGDEIRLSPNQVVILEIKLSDWNFVLKTWEVYVESATYTNGIGDPLFAATVPCTPGAFCTNTYGAGTFCSTGNCRNGFQNRSRADWVNLAQEPNEVVPGVGLGPDYNYFAVVSSESNFPVDDGSRKYGGTLLLEIPPGARGTYEIKLVEDTQLSYMADENNVRHTDISFTHARVVITCSTPLDCNDNNACTTDTCASQVCANTPNYNTTTHCCDPANGNLTLISDSNDCTNDVCNPANGTVTRTNLANLAACGNAGNSECDRPDSCNGGVCSAGGAPCMNVGGACGAGGTCGAGTCLQRFEPITTNCGNPTNTTCNPADKCNGSGSCTVNIASNGTACGSPANTQCDDPDTCNGQGDCLVNQAADGTPCQDGLFCTNDNLNERCQTGACIAGAPRDCADLLTCTTNVCDEDADACDNSELVPNTCLIDGVCYNHGTLNPTNTCEICDTTMSTSDWTVLVDGSACNDGNACTGTPAVDPDACTGGVCTGELDPNCNDTCDVAVAAIVGQNFSDNSSTAGDDGEASCEPNSNADVWFAYTALCDGAVFVSTTGSALAPDNDPVLSVYDDCPLLGGTEIACDDDSGAGLNAALIFPTTGGATYLIRVAGYAANVGPVVLNLQPTGDCLIAGVCYSDGDVNPENDCQECIPEISSTQWSNRMEGTSCDADGGGPNNGAADTDCDSPDACDGAGLCELNYKPDFIQCSDEGPPHNECTKNLCLSGLCTHPPEPVGLACDLPGEGEPDCDNADTCTGGGLCGENIEPNGFPCGSTVNTQCDNPDTCDGIGLCLDNFELPNTPCDDADVCTGSDVCSGTGDLCAGTSILQAPLVEAIDSRHIEVTPQPPGSPAPIALYVTSPDWPCLSDWVNLNGQLVGINDRVFQLVDDWGTILVYDIDIVPTTLYEFRAVCGDFMSDPGSDETFQWGDVNSNGFVNAQDVAIVIDGARGLNITVPFFAADLYPCIGDGRINAIDVSRAIDANRGLMYPCGQPCHP